MFDNILSTSLFALIAAVAVAAAISAVRAVPAPASETVALEVVTFPTVVVTGKRETAVAEAPQVVQFPEVIVTGRRVPAPVVTDVNVAAVD